jgi:hypothetical protein
MERLRISFAPRQIVRSDFAAEWFAVAAIAVIAVFWARLVRFELAVQWGDFLLPSIAILAVVIAHAANFQRASFVAEYFLLTVVATALFAVVSYLSMATGRPLADDVLLAADRAIGFDWLFHYRWLVHHATVASVLQLAYNSLVLQGLYFGLLFGIMGKRKDLREMFWLVLVAGVLTCAGAALFPALGTFRVFGIKAEFLPDMQELRSGHLHFALAKLTGVVSFPSFHTAMALIYIYGFSRAGAIGWMIALVNIVMLPAIPFFGGHYLVDMFAGGAVALVSIAAVRAWSAAALSAALLRDNGMIKLRGQLSEV